MERVWIIILAAGLWAGTTARAENKFSETRSVLDKWVEARQLIAKEKADWELDKSAMEQQSGLLQKEAELLTEQIARAQATATQIDKDRARLLEERDSLENAAVSIHESVVELEKRVVDLAEIFPPPLMERIEPLYKRIPKNPAASNVSLSERMQSVVGILSEVDKFNGNITVVPELRESPAGDNVQVKTIYLGLGVAYFVDRAEKFAGIGTPGKDGWHWAARNELAPNVARAIHVYENAAAAVFIGMPVNISH